MREGCKTRHRVPLVEDRSHHARVETGLLRIRADGCGVESLGDEEVSKLVNSSKSTTLHPIPTKLLKDVLPEVRGPLLHIINSSLSLGYVPKSFAMIKPLVKKPADITNITLKLEVFTLTQHTHTSGTVT